MNTATNLVSYESGRCPLHAVACYTQVDEVLAAGRMLIERDLQLLRNCCAENRWPGYGSGVSPCGLPPWAMKQLEQIA